MAQNRPLKLLRNNIMIIEKDVQRLSFSIEIKIKAAIIAAFLFVYIYLSGTGCISPVFIWEKIVGKNIASIK